MSRLILCLVLMPGIVGAVERKPTPESEFARGWILVRLQSPLVERTSIGGFSSVTPFPALNALIISENVQRIDHALRVTMREPKNLQALSRHGLDRTYRFHVPDGTSIGDLVVKLSNTPGVVFAEPDYLAEPRVVPNDELFPTQWGLDQSSDADVDAPEAWDLETGNTIVAVVDTGIFMGHPDLPAEKFVAGYDVVNDDDVPEDDNGHGTWVASIIAAATNNGQGIAAACWGCRVMPVKGLPGQASVSDGIVWAVDHGATIINLSLGWYGLGTETLKSAVAYAGDAGAMMMTASGNDNFSPMGVPSEYAETMTTGATNDTDWRAYPMCGIPARGSNYSPLLDFVAPGENIPIATLDGGYITGCATSFSSPLVAGLLGIMQTMNPALGREEARHLLTSAAEDELGNPLEDVPGFDVYHGWGRVNMDRAVRGVQSAMSLRADGAQATRLFFDSANLLADSYDFIRGDLDALSENWAGVNTGSVVCLENDSPDPDTGGGNEDLGNPMPGKGYFYLARFNAAPGAGSYGGSSRHRDRFVPHIAAADWTADGQQPGAQFGYSVARAGDVNGDGYDDVIVGAPRHGNGEIDEGRAYLFLGSASGLAANPTWIAESNQEGARFGTSVAGVGDVNGDGKDDVIVGAPRYSESGVEKGRVYVYQGSASGLGAVARVLRGDQADARFGGYVAGAGDVNADGYDDVVVGAHLYDNGETDEGRAYVFLGSVLGLSSTPGWMAESDQAGAEFGISVSGAGSVNGDEYDDVVIGAYLYDNGETDEGRLFVYHGTSGGPSGSPATTHELDLVDAWLGGYSVATAGDVNNDGYDDVIAAATSWTQDYRWEGGAFVYLGSASGLQDPPAWAFYGGQQDSQLYSVAGAGDVNGDNYDDIVAAADYYDTHRTDVGRAWLFHGSAAGPSSTADWSDTGQTPLGRFGWPAPAGDVNGDGYADVLVGSFGDARVYVYQGSPSGLTAPLVDGDCAK